MDILISKMLDKFDGKDRYICFSEEEAREFFDNKEDGEVAILKSDRFIFKLCDNVPSIVVYDSILGIEVGILGIPYGKKGDILGRLGVLYVMLWDERHTIMDKLIRDADELYNKIMIFSKDDEKITEVLERIVKEREEDK